MIFGKNNKEPIIEAHKIAVSTEPAATSFEILAISECLFLKYVSITYSIAVLTSSAKQTKPITKTIIDISTKLNLSMTAENNTIREIKKAVLKLRWDFMPISNPLTANLKLEKVDLFLNFVIF